MTGPEHGGPTDPGGGDVAGRHGGRDAEDIGGRGHRRPPGPMWSGADGASPERTRLAWRRTVLSSTVVAMLCVRLAERIGLDTLGGGLVIAAAAIGWLTQLWLTQRRIQAMAQPRPAAIGRTLPAMALNVVGFAVLGVILAVVIGG